MHTFTVLIGLNDPVPFSLKIPIRNIHEYATTNELNSLYTVIISTSGITTLFFVPYFSTFSTTIVSMHVYNDYLS